MFQSALTQTLYAQLFEEAITYDVMIFEGAATGSAYAIESSGRRYWYWQVSTPAGLKKTALGPESEQTLAIVERLRQRKVEMAQLLAGLKSTSAAFLASGGMPNAPAHFRVMEKLAIAGLFRKGLVLVGSHAFTALGNALGVRWQGNLHTTDMDFARSTSVALAVPEDSGEVLDVPKIAKSADDSFFLVPELDVRQPSATLASRKTKVRIDFLTTQRKGELGATRYFSDLGIAATPLRFMDYLLGGRGFKGMIVGNYAIPVRLPDPARFALHKLIIAQERIVNRDIKAHKDIRQGCELLQALFELGMESDVEAAFVATLKKSGARRNIKLSLNASHKEAEGIRKHPVFSALA
jgi:hypothetical protein